MNRLPLSALILAGGLSSRMGRDKALLPIAGATMLERVYAQTAPLFKETLVIVNDDTKTNRLLLGTARIYKDIFLNQGPLAGLYTGLIHARTSACCVLTCDMPFVESGLLQQLSAQWAEGYDAVCFQDSSGVYEPFPGVYSRSCRFLIRRLLECRESAMRRFMDAAIVLPVPLDPVKKNVLMNMNTPEDYQTVLKHENERGFR